MNDDRVDGAAHSRLAVLLVLREVAQESVSLSKSTLFCLGFTSGTLPTKTRHLGQPSCLKFEKLSPLSSVL